MERVSALLGRKSKDPSEKKEIKKEKKDKKDKDKKKHGKDKANGKSKNKLPVSATEWSSWTVENPLKEESIVAWRPTLEHLGLPAPAVGEAWPGEALRPISVDFGRSHFIFYGDVSNAELQRQQNLLYPGVAKANALPKAERVAYLSELVGGAAGEAWAGECELTSPSRNRVVARVKFELLARWLQAADARLSAEEARTTALYLMYYATQGPLAHVKRVAQQGVPPALAEALRDATFAFWRACVHHEEGDFVLRASFRNYRPGEGVWQVAYPVKDSALRWELDLAVSGRRRGGDGADWGRLTIRCRAEAVAAFTAEERKAYYGVCWPATNTVVRYCDTCPTF